MKPGLEFEKKLANELDGRLQPGSGAPWGVNGDVELRDPIPNWWNGALIEAKNTGNKSFRLKEETWKKIQREASSEGKLGIMMIGFQDSTLAIVDYQVLMDLMRVVRDVLDTLEQEFRYE